MVKQLQELVCHYSEDMQYTNWYLIDLIYNKQRS